MTNSFCYKILRSNGTHPLHPLGTFRIFINLSAVLCATVLVSFNIYKEKELEGVESLSLFLVVTTKYLTLVFSRKLIKKLLKASEEFWEVTTTDEQVKYLKQHLNRVDKFHKFLVFTGMLSYIIKPFTVSGRSSMFSCYIPSWIPYPLFFVFECYTLTFLSPTFVAFNILMCSLIISAVTQFGALNRKIGTIHFGDIKSQQDLSICFTNLSHNVRYHQRLIRYVQDVNKLLSVPIALLMVFSVSLMCMDMYILAVTKESSIVNYYKVLVTGVSIIGEFFSVYGLPAQLLMDESAAIGDTIYFESNWYLPMVRPLKKDFLMIIMRSQKNICIRAGDYHVVSNQTILLMLKTAYSFYTALQTMT